MRADIGVQASLRGCPDAELDFVSSTAIFATWVAETLGRSVADSDDPKVSVGGWASRITRALVWSVRNQRAAGLAHGEEYDDTDAWNLVLTVQDAIPIFLSLSRRDAERIQQLSMGKGRPSAAELSQARQAFLRKVVPALNLLYGTEN